APRPGRPRSAAGPGRWRWPKTAFSGGAGRASDPKHGRSRGRIRHRIHEHTVRPRFPVHVWPGRHSARANRGDPLSADHTLAELDVRAREVVVAYLEAPVQEHADRQPTGAAPTDFGDGAGVARNYGRSVGRGDVHTGVYLREELRHDALGRPPNARREHAWRVAHDETEARVAAFGHRDKQDPADRHIGRLKSDAVHVPHRVGIRAEARGDTRERLPVADHMDGGIDRRDHDRLTRPELRRVLYPVVVSDGLRRDPVPRRDRKKRLAWRDRVDLEARRVLP